MYFMNVYRNQIFINRLCLVVVVVLSTIDTYGQSLPVGSNSREDAVRRAQLVGTYDEAVSLTIRPLFTAMVFDSLHAKEKDFVIRLMPLSWKQQYNSDHPEGFNDGAMIPARGYQTLLSGGFFAKFKFVSVQFAPEFVYAANTDFQGFPDELPDSYWAKYAKDILNTIDIPERFGKDAYRKAFLGQSSILPFSRSGYLVCLLAQREVSLVTRVNLVRALAIIYL
jgi:hypothetical protein